VSPDRVRPACRAARTALDDRGRGDGTAHDNDSGAESAATGGDRGVTVDHDHQRARAGVATLAQLRPVLTGTNGHRRAGERKAHRRVLDVLQAYLRLGGPPVTRPGGDWDAIRHAAASQR
jgi:hypothetical protein